MNHPTPPLLQQTNSLNSSHASSADGEEEDADEDSAQKNWVFETSSESFFTQDSDIWNSFNSTDKEEGYSSQVRTDNNIFKLQTYRCFYKFFGLETFSHDFLWLDQGSVNVNSILAETPSNISSDSLTGCSVMNLSHKDGSFLFKSEIVVKNDKFGLGLWTGLKGSKTDSNLSVNLVNYLLFFEKKGNNWSKSGGYAWGGQDHLLRVNSLTIKSPDESTINKTFSISGSGDSSSENINYFGVWESVEDGSGTELLNFDKQEEYYSSSDPFTFSLPFIVKISSNVKGSYSVGFEGGSRSWIKYNGSSDSSGVPDNVEQWSVLVKGKKGNWKSMSDYCKGKENLPDNEKSTSLCYESKMQSEVS